MVIKQELQRIETELDASQIPEKDQRVSSIGRIVLDGWWKCNKEPLAKNLLWIANAYKRKVSV